MVVAAFPVAKLGALLLKQVSKPLANVVKARAKSSPFFRTYICMPPAQFYHWAEVKLKMWTMNLGKPVSIPKLNENMAIDLGAELVGEGIIFTIAAVILVLEYMRSTRKEAAKEEQRVQELIRIQSELKELYFAKAHQETQIRELIRVLHVNIPSSNYMDPSSYNVDNIPIHHRTEEKEPEEVSIFQSVNRFIWAAVDVILPPAAEDQKEDRRQTIIKVVPSEVSQSPPVQSPAPAASPSSSNKSNVAPQKTPEPEKKV